MVEYTMKEFVLILIAETGRQTSPVGILACKISRGVWNSNKPCILVLPSGPLKRAFRSSRRSTARQQRHRPVHHHQHFPPQPRGSPLAVEKPYHSQLIERPGRLYVLERLVQLLQLEVDLLLGRLGILDGLDLKGLDGLELAAHVDCRGLESLEPLLDLVNDGLVLEHRPVARKVDRRRELRQLLHPTARVVAALLEGLKRSCRLPTEAKRCGDLGPIDLQCCAALPIEEN